MSIVTDLAKAIVAELNQHEFSMPFEAAFRPVQLRSYEAGHIARRRRPEGTGNRQHQPLFVKVRGID